MDRWVSTPVQCKGGLVLNMDALTQGTNYPGSAVQLQNYEIALEGGYRRIDGYSKFDSAVVPGSTNNPVLGVKVALNGVFATRKLVNDNAIYVSGGSGWGSKLNSTARTGSVTKARFISYSIFEPVVIQVDGVNPAWKWNGTAETVINGTGAPTNPKFAALFRDRLILAGYSANYSAISISVPGEDDNFDAADGAIEINVGDTIVGLKTFRDILYIFCERSIKALVGTSASDFSIQEVAKNMGCLSGDTIQEVGGDVLFLSPDGFRSLAGTARVADIELGLLSLAIQPLIHENVTNNYSANSYSTCVVRHKSQYRFFINDTNSTETDALGIIGRVTDNPINPHGNYEWSTTRGIKPYCADSDLINNAERVVFGHPTSGYVYEMERGNDFDGVPISSIYRSPDITFASKDSDASIRKVFQKINVYTQVEGNASITLGLRLDGDMTGVLQPGTVNLGQTGGAAQYGSAVYDTDSYGAFTFPTFYRNLIGSGFTGAFLFTASNSNPSHRIDAFQVTYAIKGRR